MSECAGTSKWDDYQKEKQTNQDNIDRFVKMMADMGLEIEMWANTDSECTVEVKEIKTGRSFKFSGNIG